MRRGQPDYHAAKQDNLLIQLFNVNHMDESCRRRQFDSILCTESKVSIFICWYYLNFSVYAYLQGDMHISHAWLVEQNTEGDPMNDSQVKI